MTGAQALKLAIDRLRVAGVEGAARDARLILSHAMAVAPDRLTLHLGDPISDSAAELFEACILARCRRQPVSQIVGRRLFWGRMFRVTPEVLDPRPETETLVATALEAPFERVIDLGTGSGAILVSLLAECGSASGVGVDLSEAALRVAETNAREHGVGGRATLLLSDWWRGVSGSFDLVVSNPPYIPDAEIGGLAPEVRDWEPRMALSPGGDGLDAYRAIARDAPRHIEPGGRLIVEIGPTQALAVTGLLVEAGLREVEVRTDMDGRDRVVLARMAGG